MLMTSNLLTAFMLGGWIAVAPAAVIDDARYSMQGGDLRLAGNVPETKGPQAIRRSGKDAYANLNR